MTRPADSETVRHDADTFIAAKQHEVDQALAEAEALGTSLSWRSAISWLRGYSDFKAGRASDPPESTPDPAAYRRGYANSSGVPVEPALATRGCGQHVPDPWVDYSEAD